MLETRYRCSSPGVSGGHSAAALGIAMYVSTVDSPGQPDRGHRATVCDKIVTLTLNALR